jgi:anti-anti-sigma factor
LAIVEVIRDRRDAAVVVVVRGDVDTRSVDTFTAHLDDGLQSAAVHASRLLVLDLAEVTYFGSAGLNAVLGCHERGAADGIAVRIVASDAEVLRPIEVTGLDAVLRTYPALTDALAAPHQRR